MITITARTADMPLTADGATIFATLPAGKYKFRATDGGVLVVATMDTAAGQPELAAQNAERLKSLAAAARGPR